MRSEFDSLSGLVLNEKVIMNFKRQRAKNQRSGCLMCKPHKMNGNGERARAKADLLKELTRMSQEIEGGYR